jgi:hypothetical protein
MRSRRLIAGPNFAGGVRDEKSRAASIEAAISEANDTRWPPGAYSLRSSAWTAEMSANATESTAANATVTMIRAGGGLTMDGRKSMSRPAAENDADSPCRYVAYYRVSTGRQERFGFSIEAQRAAVRDYVATHPGVIVAEFSEGQERA